MLRRILARPEVRFPAWFILCSTTLWLLAERGPLRDAVAALQAGTSSLVVVGSALTGLEAQASGFVITFGTGTFSYEISRGCTAWEAAALFVAAVVAYPAKGRQRLAGILVGLPALFAVNILRLVSMAWLGVGFPGLYDQAHGFWWQAFVILAVGSGWLVWARYVESSKQGLEQAGRTKEFLVACGVFMAAMLALEVLGAWVGAFHAYSAGVIAVAESIVALFGKSVSFGWREGSETFRESLLYGGAAATVALYLATPRVPAAKRVATALTAGFATPFAFHVLVLSLNLGIALDRVARVAGDIMAYAGPVIVWYLWARRQWLRDLAAMKSRKCPACGEFPADLLAHIDEAHPLQRKRWRKAAIKANPGLDVAVDGLEPAG